MAIVSAEQVEERLRAYEAALATSTFADATRRAYASRVAGYLRWLSGPDVGGSDFGTGDPLSDAATRDRAAREYLSWLGAERAARPATLNAVRTALEHFYGELGLGPPILNERAEPDEPTPRILTPTEQRLLLSTTSDLGSVREMAIIYVLLRAGLRVAELVAVDVPDVQVARRSHQLIVRASRRGRHREIPLDPTTADVLRRWQRERRRIASPDQPACFVNQRGRRLTTRFVGDVVTQVAETAGIDHGGGTGSVNPTVLRRTFGFELAKQGRSVETIAELLGYRRVDAARPYLERAKQGPVRGAD